jgi:predicted O-linked N-acetylglucosamine transferase (SPINDLY family)
LSESDPESWRALVAASAQLIERHEYAAAATRLAAACRVAPREPSAHFLRGVCHHCLGELAEALMAFDAAAALDPGHRDARYAALAVLCQSGRADEALRRCDALTAAFADDPDAWFNCGLVHEARGDLRAALAGYDAALARDARHRPARLNRGLALTRLGRLEDAYANNHAAAEAHPDLADSHYNLAEVALALGRHDAALAHCDRALAIDARHSGALFDRALALAALGRFDDASAAWAAARSADARSIDARWASIAAGGVPPRFSPEAVYLARVYARLQECDWRERERFAALLHALVTRRAHDLPTERALAFAAVTLPVDAGDRLALARAVSAHIRDGVGPPLPRRGQRPDGKLRLGYLSADFRNHVIARVAHPLFAHRDGHAFETFAYSLAPDDGSDLRRAIASRADAFRDLSGLAYRAAAEAIAGDGIDVLVDLGGYTDGARPEIMALRPAVVQVSYLGFPSTMGADFIDYAVTDRRSTPPGWERAWHEQLIILPDTWFLYEADPVDPALAGTRAQHGLPADGAVFCAFHAAHKIGPDAFAAWLRALRAVPGSVLWLGDSGSACRANLEREAAAAGICARRLVFAPRVPLAAHLARLTLADVFLDAFGWGAVTGACDALWAGLPMVARRGEPPLGRTAAGLLALAGVPELAVDGADEYVATAVRLATAPAVRAEVRARLERTRAASLLFDARRRVRYLEAAFQEVAARARKGLPPASFEIPADPAP